MYQRESNLCTECVYLFGSEPSPFRAEPFLQAYVFAIHGTVNISAGRSNEVSSSVFGTVPINAAMSFSKALNFP